MGSGFVCIIDHMSSVKKIKPLFYVSTLNAAVALALTFSPIPTYAQDGLHLYGTIDTGLGWTHSSGESNTKGMIDNGQTDSFWGLRGSETLTNGFSATFTLESGFSPSTGGLEDEGRLFNYAAWIGLEQAELGALRLGRQNPVAQQFADELEIAPWADFGLGALFKAADNYQLSDSMSYLTPTYAGFQAGLSYSFNANEGEYPQTSHNARALSTGLRYEEGPFYATLTYDRLSPGHDHLPGQRAAQAWQLGASYDFTSFRLAAGWSSQSNGFVGLNGGGDEGIGPPEFVQGGRVQAWFVGAALPVGPGELLAQWSVAKPNWTWQDSARRAKTVQTYSLGYVYELSPRTSVYAFAAGGRNFSLEDTFTANNTRSKRVATGITHHF